jgi:hypothetical protein
MGKSNEALLKERTKRIEDAIQLKVPDRVPFWFGDLSFFPARYTGITYQEMMYDSKKLVSAYKRVILDHEPDMYFNPTGAIRSPGSVLELLDPKQIKWPGHGVSANASFQYVENEYMRADEYDEFISDPTDFILRRYLPRVFGALEHFKDMPSLKPFLGGAFAVPLMPAFLTPEITAAFRAFYEAGLASANYTDLINSFNQEMNDLGFPLAFGSGGLPPFDVISDTLRGMRGISIDMFRQPDKLLEAIEIITPVQIASAISGAKRSGNSRVLMAIHRGSDAFMSNKQFEKFYWPSFKKLMLALIDEGLTPCPFFEGNCTSRLEFLKDLPKGKILGWFDITDIFAAKKVLGNTMCISGMFPVSLLQLGTPEKIKEYTRKLIDVLGKDGGFIMGPRSAMDETDPALVKIWVDYTKEYGRYR